MTAATACRIRKSRDDWLKAVVQRVPHNFLGHIVIIMPVYVADAHNLPPRQFGMPLTK
jgi:hypothetical protein